jgi:hypothetical protein
VIGEAKLAAREAEPRPKVEDRYDGTAVVNDAGDDGRGLGERRDGHHGDNTLDLRQVKSVPLSFKTEDDALPHGTTGLHLHRSIPLLEYRRSVREST